MVDYRNSYYERQEVLRRILQLHSEEMLQYVQYNRMSVMDGQYGVSLELLEFDCHPDRSTFRLTMNIRFYMNQKPFGESITNILELSPSTSYKNPDVVTFFENNVPYDFSPRQQIVNAFADSWYEICAKSSAVFQKYYINYNSDSKTRTIDTYFKIHGPELADYLLIDEIIDERIAGEFTLDISRAYEQSLKQELDVEFAPYYDPQGDKETKEKTILTQMLNHLSGLILLSVHSIPTIIKSKRLMMIQRILNDEKYLDDYDQEKIDLIYSKIKSQSPFVEVANATSFKSLDIEKQIVKMCESYHIKERFQHVYDRYIENEFYQHFLELVREYGLTR